MSLLAEAAAHLRARDVPFALIGAGAMAVHGVARSTVDLDLLVTSAACLSATFWDTMRTAGAETIVRAGDAADLILLKLYAGGPQDLWDIAQLLGGDERRTIARAVETRLSALPAECARLWAEVSRAR